jgi:hypothetical protein
MKSRILFSVFLISLLAVFIYSCTHVKPAVRFVEIPSVEPGYEKDFWSRTEDGLSALPEVNFAVKGKKAENNGPIKIENEDVKEYSDEIAACFLTHPIDFDEAEELVYDMISDCKGEPGVDKVIFKYLSTLIYVKEDYRTLIDIAEYCKKEEKKGKNKAELSENYKTENKKLQRYFSGKTFAYEGIDKLLYSGTKKLENRIKQGFQWACENNIQYTEDFLFKLGLPCNGYDFFFVDNETSDFENESGFEVAVEVSYNSFELFEYSKNIPVFKTGERAFIRAYSLFSEENPEVEFAVYKSSPVSLFRENISFYDIKPPENAKIVKKWKQNIKGKIFESFSIYDYGIDMLLEPFRISDDLEVEIILEPQPPEEIDTIAFGPEYDIELPVKEPGLYIVEMRNGAYRKYTSVLVSDLNLMTKYDGDVLISYSDKSRIRTETGKDKKDSDKLIYTIVSKDQILKRLKSGKNGLCAVSTAGDASTGFVIASIGEHHAIADIRNPPVPDKSRRNFIYTDRPLYRPGNKVCIKVFSREIDPVSGSYIIPSGKPVNVKVRDSENNILKKVEIEPNEFGTCILELYLDEEAPLGTYYVYAGDNEGKCKFKVKEYRKAECEISISFDKQLPVVGDPLKIIVTGKYYHGQPLKNRKVDVTYSKGGEQKEFSGKFDKTGVWSTDVDTKKLESGLLYVTADVTDVSGRLFSSENYMRLYPSEVNVSLKTLGGQLWKLKQERWR